ncbi:unnamed protein product, partial [Brassica rapa subsp. narinosa]
MVFLRILYVGLSYWSLYLSREVGICPLTLIAPSKICIYPFLRLETVLSDCGHKAHDVKKGDEPMVSVEEK